MSDLIDFLESMGGDSQSRSATGPGLEEALIRAGIAPTIRSAVLAGDQARLESLIGASHIVCNLINLPDEEEEEEDEDDKEHEGDGDEEDEA
jgi:hypothetical protein